MRMKSKRLIALFVGLICAIALGGAVALAQSSDDTWTSGQANSSWSATNSGATSFASTGFGTITCSNSTASGTTTGSAPDVGYLPMNAPSWSGCGTTGGYPWTVTTHGSWDVAFWSDVTPSPTNACPSGTVPDEGNSNKDCFGIAVPPGGATIRIDSVCTITVSPGATTYVAGPLTENSPSGKDTVTFTNQSLPVSGCGLYSMKFSGTYVISLPSGLGYLDDGSGSDDATGPDADS